ncbi:MAG: hypothetical protein WAN66_15900 [Limnoraphis robusta]|jgi:hypothetical protein|nr:hypothetical protein [Limnoraphis robusta]MEA5500585.1 hypothetical protein [Limnoraphis robusta BA-68 BA1]MEA5522768.1 hypothetical protein [Limnoraphis robusta CCNP1315]MEA5541393.1 hypothetical protein [Limnoraphis robusta Tam1]MEA5543770.1 hypothetical protein [Limnoraphis robusta CCNP1324]
MMQLRETNKIAIDNSTLSQLILELGEECQNVLALTNQLQLANLSAKQKVEILAELLTATIHLQTHCDEDLQNLISQELENTEDTL